MSLIKKHLKCYTYKPPPKKLIHTYSEVWWCQWFMETILFIEFPEQNKDRTTIGSGAITVSCVSKEWAPGYDRVSCTPMFTAALFTIARLWKQSTCLTSNEWIKKTWYIYTMAFHSVIKNNEIMFAGKWMEHFVKWSKTGWKSQRLRFCTYVKAQTVN
jgi:hypothetical protein